MQRASWPCMPWEPLADWLPGMPTAKTRIHADVRRVAISFAAIAASPNLLLKAANRVDSALSEPLLQFASNRAFMPSATEIVSDIGRLVSMPASYLRVKQVIDDPDGSLQSLADAIALDPAMSARILRIANSPLFGMNRHVDRIGRAVSILGTQQVHDLVLAWAVRSAFLGAQPHGLNIDDFWRGSVRRALASRYLASDNGILDAGRLFVEGLLSNIGHLIIYCQVPELAAHARAAHALGRLPLYEAQRDAVGCDYAEVGAALVLAWNLPEPFYEPILKQIDPASATVQPTEAAILHVAGQVAESCGTGELPTIAALSPFAVALLELDDSGICRVQQHTEENMQAVLSNFLPGPAVRG